MNNYKTQGTTNDVDPASVDRVVLLPCPCCGANPVRRPHMVVYDDWGNKDEHGVVFCTNCGLNIETCHGQAEAEKRWNTREKLEETRTIEFVGHGFPPKE